MIGDSLVFNTVQLATILVLAGVSGFTFFFLLIIMARWPSGLERWLVQATGLSWPGSNPTAETVSFGGDTKSRRSLLSGVYARGSKRSHQSALECVTVVDATTLREGQL